MNILCIFLVSALNCLVTCQVLTQKYDAFRLNTLGQVNDAKFVQCFVPEFADSQSFFIEVVPVIPSTLQPGRGCAPRNVSIYIQHGSQPLLPSGGLPSDIEFFTRRTNLMTYKISSLDGSVGINIERPLAGFWYLASFIDPEGDGDRWISPNGLGTKSCTYLLSLQHYVVPITCSTFDLHINRAPLRYVLGNSASSYFNQRANRDAAVQVVVGSTMQFRIASVAEQRITLYALEIIIERCITEAPGQDQQGSRCPLIVSANSGTLPTSLSPSINCSLIETNQTLFTCTLLFDLANMQLATYVSVTALSNRSVSFDLRVQSRECTEALSALNANNDAPYRQTFGPADVVLNGSSNGMSSFNSTPTATINGLNTTQGTRADGSGLQVDSRSSTAYCVVSQRLSKYYSLSQRFNFLFFDSGLLAPTAVTYSLPIVVSERGIQIIPFSIDRLLDQGGTLNFEFKLMDTTDSCVSTSSSDPSTNATNSSSSTATSSCPHWRIDVCVTREKLPIVSADTASWKCDPQVSLSTNLSSSRSDTVVYYPYPESGLYFLSFRLVRTNTSGTGDNATIRNNLAYYADTPSSVLTPKMIQFEVSSAPCLDGSCNGKLGECVLTDSFQNLRFAFCDCKYGNAGFACTNSTKARSSSRQIVEMTLLMASNVAFIPAVIVAAHRRFWMEAAIYAYTMLASSIYHACDSETLYSFCVLPQPSLSILDFFGSLSSLMVTVLCIADLQHANAKAFILTCSLLIALVAITANRFSIWSFAAPIAVCCAVLVVSWSRRCYASLSCHPPKRDWLTRFLPGALLLIAALSMFMGLETTSNYYLVHSAWHVLAALACVVVLPRHIASKSKSPSANSIDTDIVMSSHGAAADSDPDRIINVVAEQNGNGNGNGNEAHCVFDPMEQVAEDEALLQVRADSTDSDSEIRFDPSLNRTPNMSTSAR